MRRLDDWISGLFKRCLLVETIRKQLSLLTLIGVSSIAAAFGGFNIWNQYSGAERRFEEQKNLIAERLRFSLPNLMWNIDRSSIVDVLDSELNWQGTLALKVVGSGDIDVGRMRDQLNNKKNMDAKLLVADEELRLGIYSRDAKPLGYVIVYLTRSELREEFAASLVRVLAEIIVLATLVYFFTVYLLGHFVFSPLEDLRRKLQLIALGGDGANARVDRAGQDELGQLAVQVNAIIERVESELRSRVDAEKHAVEEKRRAEIALEQLKQAQNSLIESERLSSLGGLVAGVAHEINTPVGLALTMATHLAQATDQVSSKLEGGGVRKADFQAYLETARDASRIIYSNAERAAALIQSFKQIAVDQTSEEKRKFDLLQYLNEVCLSLSPRLKRHKISIQLNCPGGLEIDGYPGALAQIVSNLVMNSVVHAYDDGVGGIVELSAAENADGYISMCVRDHGHGIPDAVIKKIFDPFFTTKRGNGGSGLGLNIVYNLTRRALNGNITVDSKPGVGTAFHVVFPRVVNSSALSKE